MMAFKIPDINVGHIDDSGFRGGLEITSVPGANNAFHGTTSNQPMNPSVSDHFVGAYDSTLHRPETFKDKSKLNMVLHSEEADIRALGLGKEGFTDDLDINQEQPSKYPTSVKPLPKHGTREMATDKPFRFEETKDSVGPFLHSSPLQKEYVTMASRREEEMTFREKIMDRVAEGWEKAMNLFTGGAKKGEAEKSDEKLTEKAADIWEETKVKINEVVDTMTDSDVDSRKKIASESSPKDKPTAVKFTEKIEDTWQTGLGKPSKGSDEIQVTTKKTVTYASDTMDKTAEELWKAAHVRDEKLYDETPEKLMIEESYETKQLTEGELRAIGVKFLLEPYEREVIKKDLPLHNPVERTDAFMNEEEALQEIAETASELLAIRMKREEYKTPHQKKEEKGQYKNRWGLNAQKLVHSGEQTTPRRISEQEAPLEGEELTAEDHEMPRGKGNQMARKSG